MRTGMRVVLCVLEMLDDASPNACGYLRIFLPLTKKIVSDCFDVRFVRLDELKHFKAEIVITHRMAVDTLAKALHLVSYCRQTGARLVFDLDDDLLSLPRQHPEFGKYEALKHVGLRLVTEADELWVSTTSLASRYSGVARYATVMPNQLDDRLWDALVPTVPNADRPIRFLYMGTSTHRPDFDQLVTPAFSQLKAEFGDKIELDLIGVVDGPATDGHWRILNHPADAGNSYPAFITWLQSLPRYDIGLAPLLEFVFNSCKSDVKWLEYSAMGLATIAANLPAYNASIEHERTGLLADSNANAFRAAMRRLIVEGELRRSLQRQALQLASEKLRLSPIVEPRLERLNELTRQPRRTGLARVVAMPPVATSAVFRGHIDRRVLSYAFVHGRGIEIGPLQNPLPVSSDAQVTYVDRRSNAELRQNYPELQHCNLANVEIVDNAETLASFQSGSHDFIIANHLIEHCEDPIRTIKTFVRVLRPGGIIYMAIPDMRHTFDRDRSRTSLAHIIADHVSGPEISREQHFREWVTLVEPHFGRAYAGDAIEARVRELIGQDYSIHFHTFIPDDVHALIKYCAAVEGMPLCVVFAGEFDEEMIFIVRRLNSSGGKLERDGLLDVRQIESIPIHAALSPG
jgi:SAM-dependent methyltransferase/glycosyltransferase involved in cell wall biosynthesis